MHKPSRVPLKPDFQNTNFWRVNLYLWYIKSSVWLRMCIGCFSSCKIDAISKQQNRKNNNPPTWTIVGALAKAPVAWSCCDLCLRPSCWRIIFFCDFCMRPSCWRIIFCCDFCMRRSQCWCSREAVTNQRSVLDQHFWVTTCVTSRVAAMFSLE